MLWLGIVIFFIMIKGNYDKGKRKVDDQQIQSVFTKMLQQREALMRFYKKSGCLELAKKEQAEIDSYS